MRSLLYIHGFLSSPESGKARQVAGWCQQHRPDLVYVCPALTAYPGEAILQLETIIGELPGPTGIIGSSLGGFYATLLAGKLGVKAVLINPAVAPHRLISEYIGKPLQNYHSEDIYQLDDSHLQQLQSMYEKIIIQPENLWLMAQTGDETLDYRQAVDFYKGCPQTIELGGDHSFQQFEQHIPAIIRFLSNRLLKNVGEAASARQKTAK